MTKLATGVPFFKWFADGKRAACISWVWTDLASEAAQAKRKKEHAEAKVKAYGSAILHKLDVDSRTQAVIAVSKIEEGQFGELLSGN